MRSLRERIDEDRKREREYESEVSYSVWRLGGNPDNIDPDRVSNDYYNNVSEDDSARSELRRQRRSRE